MPTATKPPDYAHVIYKPWPKQRHVINLVTQHQLNEVLYGGQAGGGKSAVIRMLAFLLGQNWPGANIAVFRRTYGELEETHLREFQRELPEELFHFSRSHMRLELSNGTRINLNHAATKDDVYNYQSVEFSALFIDEVEQFDEEEIGELTSRVRAPAGLRDRWAAEGHPWWPLVFFTANPGGKGHAFLSRTFVKKAEQEGEHWTDTVEIGDEKYDITRAFVPAAIEDNPSLDRKTYMARLAHMPVARRIQLMEGDWDFFEGKAFDFLDAKTHLVDLERVFGPQRRRPLHWDTLVHGLDHGQVNPTAFLSTVEDDEGYFLTYHEYYEPDTPVGTHIEAVKDWMQLDGSLHKFPYCDPQMDRMSRGLGQKRWSLRQEYLWGGEPPDDVNVAEATGIRLTRGVQDRQVRLYTLQRLLTPDENRPFPSWHPRAGDFGSPRLFIARNCPNFWRELNLARYEHKGPDGTASEDIVKVDDHTIDAAGFSIPHLERNQRPQGLRPRANLIAKST